MKARLYEGLDAQEVQKHLEAENCGVEDTFEYVDQFDDENQQAAQEQLTAAMVKKKRLQDQIKALTEPLQEEIKPLTKEIKEALEDLDRGGRKVYGKVYCFPDYEANLMGLYNEQGKLVGTRQLSRTERQLHINSFKPVTHGETIHSGTGG